MTEELGGTAVLGVTESDMTATLFTLCLYSVIISVA